MQLTVLADIVRRMRAHERAASSSRSHRSCRPPPCPRSPSTTVRIFAMLLLCFALSFCSDLNPHHLPPDMLTVRVHSSALRGMTASTIAAAPADAEVNTRYAYMLIFVDARSVSFCLTPLHSTGKQKMVSRAAALRSGRSRRAGVGCSFIVCIC